MQPMTHLCVSIFVRDVAQAKRDIAAAAEAGADMVELRVDQFNDVHDIDLILSAAIVPCIVTCRPQWEGGQSALPDDERLALLRTISQMHGNYVDVERESIVRHPKLVTTEKPRIIVSTHDFRGRPDRLYNLIQEMNETWSGVNKIVWTARTIRDNLEAFELLQTRQKPTIALCMGEAGMISRILAKKFGAFLTFASLGKTDATAAGQVPIADMKNLYRWDAIGPQTKVYGVVAQPVMHSMSPALHNAGFAHVGHDGVYLPMLVEGSYESFKAFMESFIHFDGLHLSGLSVTLPHKENALRYLQEKGAQVEELATRIGAVNTVIIENAGKSPVLRGMNTDYAAILDSITDTLGIAREKLADYRVAIIGAGGTGRTAVAALAHCGATVVIYNRTKEKADALAAEFDGRSGKVVSARMEKLCDSCCHIFINTTSLGMHPKVDQSPIDGMSDVKFSPDTLVFDTVYNPMQTKLLTQASAAGARTIGGVEMFVRQAAAQFRAWTGQPAPIALFRRILQQRLGA